MKRKNRFDTAADPATDPSTKPPPPPPRPNSRKRPWSKPSVLELSISGRTRQKATHMYNEVIYYQPQS